MDSTAFIFKEDNEIVALVSNFKKLNSNGEYIFDHMFENAYYQIGSNYFPKYLSGIPFTPVTRLKFIYSKFVDQDKIIGLILKVIKEKIYHLFTQISSIQNLKNQEYKFLKGLVFNIIGKQFFPILMIFSTQ